MQVSLWHSGKEDTPEFSEDRYYFLIGAEGVISIEVSTLYSSGGVKNANGSAFKSGEKVWLEQLQGVRDLRGIAITAFGTDGNILYNFFVPENASPEVIMEMVEFDSWLLVPTDFEVFLDEESAEESVPVSDEPEENAPAFVKWTFSPMMSTIWHAAFQFEFGLENYTHIEATCSNGKLWNIQAQGQPRDNKMRFEQGEPLCWTPEIEGQNFTYMVGSAFVTFTVYDGYRAVHPMAGGRRQ